MANVPIPKARRIAPITILIKLRAFIVTLTKEEAEPIPASWQTLRQLLVIEPPTKTAITFTVYERLKKKRIRFPIKIFGEIIMNLAEKLLTLISSIYEDRLPKNMVAMYESLIRDIRKLSYPDAVEFIEDIVKDRKLRFLLSLGFGGELANVDLQSNTTYITAYDLIPTQSEIDISRSLVWSLNGKKSLEDYFKNKMTVVSPIVTFQGRYIIDGHHRWSQAYCTNPKLKVFCINYNGNLSITSMLKAVQATIGTNTGRIPKLNIQGKSFYDASEEEIRRYIEKNLTEKSENEYKMYVNCNTREDVVKYILHNCMLLKEHNQPVKDSQDRDIMPQTSKDPHVFTDLSAGVTKI